MAAYYSSSSSSRGGGGSGSTHRAVALDLMLRTFMNSPDFQPGNPRMWEGIAKLVPGTTPQQCIQRWEELRSASRFLARDLSVLAAKGRPVSSSNHLGQHNYSKHEQSFTSSVSELPPITDSMSRPSSSISYSFDQLYRGSLSAGSGSSGAGGYRLSSGKFTASFCQNYLNRREKEEKKDIKSRGISTQIDSNESDERLSVTSDCNPNASTQPTGSATGNATGSATGSATGNTTGNTTGSATGSTTGSATGSATGNATGNTTGSATVNTTGDATGDATGSTTGSVNAAPVNASTDFTNTTVNASIGSVRDSSHQMVIHVRDEAKKMTKDFYCSQELLIQKMKYFSDYLTSSDMGRHWEEVDISVHCDIGVFHWLMCYVKKGLKEGPTGEILDSPLEAPELLPNNAVSILISSDFLKMDSLVEECLDYCHQFLSEVIASPSNMNCISSSLLNRLAQRFSPLQIERVHDEKDKIKSKLYFRLLERLFDLSYSHPECPNNAATLFKCKHCGHLLTNAQENVFLCNSNRMEIDRLGRIRHKHERDYQWSIDRYLASMSEAGMTLREIYWRLWGKVNWLDCTECDRPFQCSALTTCYYHPKPVVHVDCTGAKLPQGVGRYFCCSQLTGVFNPLQMAKNGCCCKDHSFTSHKNNSTIVNILKELRDVICEATKSNTPPNQGSSQIGTVLSNELRAKSHSLTKVPSPMINTARRLSTIESTSSSAVAVLREQLQESQETVTTETLGGISAFKRPIQSKGVGPKRQSHLHAMEEECSMSSDENTSELEEDEEDTTTRKATAAAVVLTQKQPTVLQQRKTIRKARSVSRSKTVSETDWTWDSTKPSRWNQDMQRCQDESRITQLQSELKNMITTASSSRSEQILKSTKSSDSIPAGGLFVQLENQFMAANKSQSNVRNSKKHSTGKIKWTL